MTHARQIEEEDEEFMESIADDDYIFVMDSQGNLKSVMLPEEYTNNSGKCRKSHEDFRPGRV